MCQTPHCILGSQRKGADGGVSLASSRKRSRGVWLTGMDQGWGEVAGTVVCLLVYSHILSFGLESPGIVAEQQKHGLPASVNIPLHGKPVGLCADWGHLQECTTSVASFKNVLQGIYYSICFVKDLYETQLQH